ncbi:hypothetical protein CPB84DRAFT_1844081 [Gymnopilus junonius]|uniref:Uncharacterized protein n=1 Tax=Gymnopilus junonius TaxID=109634 RepID=A0A9P5TRK0_GYMJU|nr:hypothetical protein CPB84DRAFT_1844081 [Gymnopilus junonius]
MSSFLLLSMIVAAEKVPSSVSGESSPAPLSERQYSSPFIGPGNYPNINEFNLAHNRDAEDFGYQRIEGFTPHPNIFYDWPSSGHHATNESSSPILLKVIPPTVSNSNTVNEVQQQANNFLSTADSSTVRCESSSQQLIASQPLTPQRLQEGSQPVSSQQLLSPFHLSEPLQKGVRVRSRKPFDKQNKVVTLKAKIIILSDKYHSLQHLLRWHPDKRSEGGRRLTRRLNAVTLQMKSLQGCLQRRRTLWEIYYED